MASRVVVAVGTKKGLFVFEGSPSAKRLELRGPFFGGMPINAALVDRRSKTPKVVAVPSSPWFGTTIQVSKDLGKKFTIIIVAEGAREKDGEFVIAGAHAKIDEPRPLVSGLIQDRSLTTAAARSHPGSRTTRRCLPTSPGR